MVSYKEFKSFYLSNIILFIILLFVIIYIIINWELVSNGNYWSGLVVKPILITGIIFLITHMLLTWDDGVDSKDSDIIIQKYKLGQHNYELEQANIANKNFNMNPINQIVHPNINIGQHIQENSNPNIQTQQLNSKYKISNRLDTNPFARSIQDVELNIPITHPPINPNKLTDSKLSNQHIFISHKNIGKYGLKF